MLISSRVINENTSSLKSDKMKNSNTTNKSGTVKMKKDSNIRKMQIIYYFNKGETVQQGENKITWTKPRFH